MRTEKETDNAEAYLDGETLEGLMERYQMADSSAAQMLIERLSPEMMRFFLALSSSRTEAEDLFQETWLRIHRVRHTYRHGAPVRPWVFAIARHVRVDGFRKRLRVQKHETAGDTLPQTAQPEPDDRAQPPAFETLMSELPDSQREVVTLLKVNGLSLEEVARVTSSSVGAVKQKASRAYTKLRAVLEEWKQRGGSR